MGAWIQAVAATNAVVLAMNVATGVISARVLGPGGKGLFNAVAVWMNVFTALAGMGIPAAFISLYAKASADDRPELARGGFALACLWGILGSVAVYVLEPKIIGHMNPAIASWARLSSPMVGILVISGMGGAMLSVRERFDALNWLGFGRTFIYLLCLVVLALTTTLTPYAQLAVSWTLLAASSLLIIWTGAKALPLSWGPVSSRVLRLLAGLGLGYYSLSLLGMFNSQLDQMIASAWLSARDMGLYAVAISSLSVAGTLQGAIGTVMFPMIAGDDKAAVLARTVSMMRRMMPLFVALWLALCAVAWPVLWVLYGSAYLPAVPVVLLISPTALLVSGIMVFYQAFYALRWFAGPAIGEAVGAGTGALFLWLLIPRWGLEGAAVAASLSYALDLVAVIWYWSRTTRIPVSELKSTREDVRILYHQLRTRLSISRLLRGAWG